MHVTGLREDSMRLCLERLSHVPDIPGVGGSEGTLMLTCLASNTLGLGALSPGIKRGAGLWLGLGHEANPREKIEQMKSQMGMLTTNI